jgi:hypothetical protein
MRGIRGFSPDATASGSRFPEVDDRESAEKRWDYRSVLLYSSAEERKRRTAVDAENWADDSDYRWGVRPVSLEQLVEERKLELQQAIAATSLEALAESTTPGCISCWMRDCEIPQSRTSMTSTGPARRRPRRQVLTRPLLRSSLEVLRKKW